MTSEGQHAGRQPAEATSGGAAEQFGADWFPPDSDGTPPSSRPAGPPVTGQAQTPPAAGRALPPADGSSQIPPAAGQAQVPPVAGRAQVPSADPNVYAPPPHATPNGGSPFVVPAVPPPGQAAELPGARPFPGDPGAFPTNPAADQAPPSAWAPPPATPFPAPETNPFTASEEPNAYRPAEREPFGSWPADGNSPERRAGDIEGFAPGSPTRGMISDDPGPMPSSPFAPPASAAGSPAPVWGSGFEPPRAPRAADEPGHHGAPQASGFGPDVRVPFPGAPGLESAAPPADRDGLPGAAPFGDQQPRVPGATLGDLPDAPPASLLGGSGGFAARSTPPADLPGERVADNGLPIRTRRPMADGEAGGLASTPLDGPSTFDRPRPFTAPPVDGPGRFDGPAPSDGPRPFDAPPAAPASPGRPTHGVPGSPESRSPAFGSPAFGSPATSGSAFGSPATGNPASGGSAFGSPASGGSAFGSAASGSPATGSPAFGSASFGDSTSNGPARGGASGGGPEHGDPGPGFAQRVPGASFGADGPPAAPGSPGIAPGIARGNAGPVIAEARRSVPQPRDPSDEPALGTARPVSASASVPVASRVAPDAEAAPPAAPAQARVYGRPAAPADEGLAPVTPFPGRRADEPADDLGGPSQDLPPLGPKTPPPGGNPGPVRAAASARVGPPFAPASPAPEQPSGPYQEFTTDVAGRGRDNPMDRYGEDTSDMAGRNPVDKPYVPEPALPSMHARPPLTDGFPPRPEPDAAPPPGIAGDRPRLGGVFPGPATRATVTPPGPDATAQWPGATGSDATAQWSGTSGSDAPAQWSSASGSDATAQWSGTGGSDATAQWSGASGSDATAQWSGPARSEGAAAWPAPAGQSEAAAVTGPVDTPAAAPDKPETPHVRVLPVTVMVVLGAAIVLGLVFGVVWLISRGTGSSDSGFSVSQGDCVKRAGDDAVKATCGDAGSYQVVSIVDAKDKCPDPGQPYVLNPSGDDQHKVLCLKPNG
ncbi:hypothetical protein [Krasilnikovia sp. MM14-A1004]|uniref:LppU/SCO3897 family protein n=1 Tax=Krasilnikovia sp. MM14-A1004 TaxID=3373541 RepID=UPI00399C7D59